MEAHRAKTGARVMGRRAVRAQSWRARPHSRERRFGLSPRVAARNKWARIEALQRNARFIEAYRDARARWLAHQPTLFPAGTYWLRRFTPAPVAPFPRGSPLLLAI